MNLAAVAPRMVVFISPVEVSRSHSWIASAIGHRPVVGTEGSSAGTRMARDSCRTNAAECDARSSPRESARERAALDMSDLDRIPQSPESGGCRGTASEPPALPGAARRRFLAGGLIISTFAVTLPARGSGTCGPISAAGSPNASHTVGTLTCMGGRSPIFWQNNGSQWPGFTLAQICTVPIGTLFAGTMPMASTVGIITSITLRNAVCSPPQPFYLQFVSAFLNAQVYGASFGYPSGAAVAQAVVTALDGLSPGDRALALAAGGGVTTALANLNFTGAMGDPPFNSGNPPGTPLQGVSVCNLTCT